MLRKGFSYIELIVVIGIVSLLSAFSVFSLVGLQTKTSVNVIMSQVLADIRSQQTRAMAAADNGTTGAGIYFENNKYTLFSGSTFVTGQAGNFVVNLQTPWQLSAAIPNRTLIFTPGSGEIQSYQSNAKSITLTHTDSGESATINLNKYGVTE